MTLHIFALNKSTFYPIRWVFFVSSHLPVYTIGVREATQFFTLKVIFSFFFFVSEALIFALQHVYLLDVSITCP